MEVRIFAEEDPDFLARNIESYLSTVCHKPKFHCDVKTVATPYEIYEY